MCGIAILSSQSKCCMYVFRKIHSISKNNHAGKPSVTNISNPIYFKAFCLNVLYSKVNHLSPLTVILTITCTFAISCTNRIPLCPCTDTISVVYALQVSNILWTTEGSNTCNFFRYSKFILNLSSKDETWIYCTGRSTILQCQQWKVILCTVAVYCTTT